MDVTKLDNEQHLLHNQSSCTYTKQYCEENVYKLCQQLADQKICTLDNLFVVFISNQIQKIPLWQQKSGDFASEFLVAWDYHVILIQKETNNQEFQRRSKVWDLDTLLNFPCNFDYYCMHALRTQQNLQQKYKRFYRVINGNEFLRFFASDRSHMRGGDGSWLAAPPDYPPIVSEDGKTMNLFQYVDMEIQSQNQFGKVMNQEEFISFFGS
eukprot:TRINITY_DN5717_c0_g1_i2.p2 TRINITY_DN5717_c0_g1~~TRINITY_DN5717_c0_g1_i2.p2  ORF type:complete len:211 (-),score=16.18 TRINITY_DN5717_c0_g1_i2:86-718(-)